ncbi:hypothetical protein B0T25DRAFT_543984 [Lasiosphaeria hispida]|uniref:Uncharacterized protein n=1 Tax=Lasiosphaeria hispida TaxID=260671 RepID=A0AAJ0ME90_9PEZI|nr:hypothetical protein B0T25DRAFT_543984 [Lasiosphaeria hispida]
MSFPLPSLRGLASRLFSRSALLPSTTTTTAARTTRPFTTAQPTMASKPASKPASKKPAPGGAAKPKSKGRTVERDPKIVNMLQHFAALSPRRIPAPLRMGRNRHLRHWTIHRAWLLFRRKAREERERTLMRQHQSMSAACEALRLTEGPGTRDQGYLYRVAMEKKGVYGLNGVPIEYARAQTDTPARVAWNHDWKA